MTIFISQITLEEGTLSPSFKKRLSKNGPGRDVLKNELLRHYNSTKTTSLGRKGVTVDKVWCRHLNNRYPEFVSSDPIRDCKALKYYQTHKNRYPFHVGYPPLRITPIQQVPKSSGAIESVGAMMAGLLMKHFGYPIVRCVGKFPDFICRTPKNEYVFVEAKATQNRSGSAQKAAFLADALNEFYAGVCQKAALVSTEIEDLNPLTVKTTITIVSLSGVTHSITADVKESIYNEVKELAIDTMLRNREVSVEQVFQDILQGDAGLAADMTNTFGDRFIKEVKVQERKSLLVDSDEQTNGHSNNGSLPMLSDCHPVCPIDEDPTKQGIVLIEDQRFIVEGRALYPIPLDDQ